MSPQPSSVYPGLDEKGRLFRREECRENAEGIKGLSPESSGTRARIVRSHASTWGKEGGKGRKFQAG